MEITKPGVLKIAVSSYTDKEGQTIHSIQLDNADMTVELTNIGCAIVAIRTPDRQQEKKNIVAGFSDLELYKVNKDYYGCLVGRYANRISKGTFELEGKRYQLAINNPPNHLHGGWQGFSYKVWKLEEVIEREHECGVVFSYTSSDGEEAYPGTLDVMVQYVLDHRNRLTITYKATTDQPTPVNLTNHSYFNLTGFEQSTILQHSLQVNGDRYVEKTEHNTPSGNLPPVAGTVLDFTTPKQIGQDIPVSTSDKGYDHSFVLSNEIKRLLKAAVLTEPTTGRMLTVYTDKPAIQVYTANFWDGTTTGEQGHPYLQHGAIALETQSYPDSVNHTHFPNTILRPGEQYSSTTVFEFEVI